MVSFLPDDSGQSFAHPFVGVGGAVVGVAFGPCPRPRHGADDHGPTGAHGGQGVFETMHVAGQDTPARGLGAVLAIGFVSALHDYRPGALHERQAHSSVGEPQSVQYRAPP